jgi:hypothetical protein
MISRIARFPMVLVGLTFMFAGIQAQTARAQDHVVPQSDLQKAVSQAAKTRQAQEAKIDAFLGTPRARRALASADIDYKTVEKGLPLLSDREVAELSARSEKAQSQFAAGALSNQDLTYIVIALATAVIILVIVYH